MPVSGRLARNLILCGLLLAVAPDARAQSEGGDPAAPSPRAIETMAIYDGDGVSTVTGGLRRDGVYLGVARASALVDLQRLLGWAGATTYAEVVWIHGGQPSELTGDAQGISNLAGPSGVRLEEAWAQVNLLAGRLSLLGGRYDLNKEFYRLQSAGLFLNSSFGIGAEFAQSGRDGPSIYPRTALGTRIAYKPRPNIVLRTALFDGVPVDRPGGVAAAFQAGDGLLVVSEAAFLDRPTSGDRLPGTRFRIGRASKLTPYSAKVAVGGWYYTTRLEDLSALDASGRPVSHSGSGGAYVIADATLARSHRDPQRRLTLFAQAGIGDERVSRFGTYIGVGLTATGVVRKRSQDEIGLAVAAAHAGSHFRRAEGLRTLDAETAFELTYLAQIASRLAVQPNLQFVVHPGNVPTAANALALQLRFEVKF